MSTEIVAVPEQERPSTSKAKTATILGSSPANSNPKNI